MKKEKNYFIKEDLNLNYLIHVYMILKQIIHQIHQMKWIHLVQSQPIQIWLLILVVVAVVVVIVIIVLPPLVIFGLRERLDVDTDFGNFVSTDNGK